MKIIQFLAIAPFACINAFTTPTFSTKTSHALSAETNSRRAFLSTAVVASIIGSGVMPSFAEDVDDLAMPSEEEQTVQTVSYTTVMNRLVRLSMHTTLPLILDKLPREMRLRQ